MLFILPSVRGVISLFLYVRLSWSELMLSYILQKFPFCRSVWDQHVVARLEVPSLGPRHCEETGRECGALDGRLAALFSCSLYLVVPVAMGMVPPLVRLMCFCYIFHTIYDSLTYLCLFYRHEVLFICSVSHWLVLLRCVSHVFSHLHSASSSTGRGGGSSDSSSCYDGPAHHACHR